MSTRPSFDDIAASNPTVAELEADPSVSLKPSACLARLPERYFHEFSLAAVAEHVGKLCALTTEQPFQIEMEPGPSDAPEGVGITVLSFDVEGMLGLLTGILGASGFDIQSGSVYTLAPGAGTADDNTQARRRGRRRTAQSEPGLPARRIVDRFVGAVPESEDVHSLRESLADFLGRVLPEMLPGRDREQARRMVNEAVADDGREGWVPDDLVTETDDGTVASRDFSAIELTCSAGDAVDIVWETHGWAWCRNRDGSEGWLPLRNLSER